ncbi:hypothetical protein LUZ60_017893 [Juncus effusus]|nr:hypothetical protein LUZ60_017893 [Juncus effusus]
MPPDTFGRMSISGSLATNRLALRRFNCTKELGALCLCPKPVRARPGTSSRQLSDLGGGGTNPCDKGLDLSGSWQQGHSATYNCPVAYLSRLQRILPTALVELSFVAAARGSSSCGGSARYHGPIGAYAPTSGSGGAAGTGAVASLDSDLEAFSHNPAHGSFAPLAFQPCAMTNCVNQRFLSY